MDQLHVRGYGLYLGPEDMKLFQGLFPETPPSKVLEGNVSHYYITPDQLPGLRKALEAIPFAPPQPYTTAKGSRALKEDPRRHLLKFLRQAAQVPPPPSK